VAGLSLQAADRQFFSLAVCCSVGSRCAVFSGDNAIIRFC
jgi:hypothetical protein